MTSREAPFTLEQLTRLLKAAPDDLILVGGQALAFWADYYGVDAEQSGFSGAISRDADFLGMRKNVGEIAKHVNGTPTYPHERALTALAGQVRIHLANDQFLNVDVIHRVYGLEAQDVRRRALKGALEDATFLVMHPLDVLQSRIENLADIKDKQTPEGIAQALLAVKVVNSHLAKLAKYQAGEKAALKQIEHVVRIAKSAAGRKTAREFGVKLLDALPLDEIPNEQFQAIRKAQIIAELKHAW